MLSLIERFTLLVSLSSSGFELNWLPPLVSPFPPSTRFARLPLTSFRIQGTPSNLSSFLDLLIDTHVGL